MDNTTGAALLGLIGVVLGGLIKAFEDNLRSLLPASSKDKRWLGGWNCTWQAQSATGIEPADPIRDVVVIDKVRGENISGTGRSRSDSQYYLTGRISPAHLMTFYYKGERSRELLGGVVILRPTTATCDQMSGHWWQCAPDGKIWGGSVVWDKLPG